MAILAPTILYCARYLLMAPVLRWSRSRLGSTMTFTIYDLYDLRPSTISVSISVLAMGVVCLRPDLL